MHKRGTVLTLCVGMYENKDGTSYHYTAIVAILKLSTIEPNQLLLTV